MILFELLKRVAGAGVAALNANGKCYHKYRVVECQCKSYKDFEYKWKYVNAKILVSIHQHNKYTNIGLVLALTSILSPGFLICSFVPYQAV